MTAEVRLIGEAIVRREDPALLTGRGRYVDDVAPEGALHAFVVRSPLAHARILSVDVTEARETPGVVAVYTAADLAELGVGPLPGAEGLPPGSLNPQFPVLASGKVLWAGQPVVLVVAETSEQAADAAELVMVDYDELPVVIGPLDAAADGAPVLHDGADSNIAVRKRITTGDAAAAFESAAYRVGQRMVSQRIAPVALEPRGVLASVAADGRLDVRLPTQRPHGSRAWLAKILGMPPAQIHVAAGDVGGGFGAKGAMYPDQVAVIAAARALGRPVKWIEERSESFLATSHGRDQVADLEVAVDDGGRITAMRGTVHASFGAYFTPNAPGSLLGRLGPMLPQGYQIGHFDVELTGVFANTTPIGPYRGAGRPEGAYFCERLVDLVALETGIDPAEVRRRNFIPPAHFPYTSCHRPDLRQRRLPGGPGPAAGKARRHRTPGPRRPAPRHRHRLVRGARRHHAADTRPRRHGRRQGDGDHRRRTARSRSRSAPAPTARATRRRSPSSRPTCSACRTRT